MTEVAPQRGGNGIEWIEDDYPKALAQAQAENLPLLVDMWADWCHTCLAMKHGVLQDRGLAELSDRYVWLSIDTEKPSSAPVMEKFPVKSWPTFFVVSPANEAVQAVAVGSTSVQGFREFLKRGSEGHLAQGEAAGELDSNSPSYHLRAGDRARAKGEYRAAARNYGMALKLGGSSWDRKTEVLAAQISALSNDDKALCAELAMAKLQEATQSHTVAAVDFTYYASSCAEALPDRPRLHLRTLCIEALDTIVVDLDASLSSDDRSDALGLLRSLATELGQSERAQGYARAQQRLLSEAVSNATSAKEEMTYVWHQVQVHAFLKRGEEILPWVESLEKRLPNEYDPPYRRAWLLHQLGRAPEALKPAKVALSLAKGRRRGRIHGLIADIHKAQGQTGDERTAREAALAHYQNLPPGHRSQSSIDQAKAALDAMPQPGAKTSE